MPSAARARSPARPLDVRNMAQNPDIGEGIARDAAEGTGAIQLSRFLLTEGRYCFSENPTLSGFSFATTTLTSSRRRLKSR